MADRLTLLLALQRELQADSFGTDPCTLTTDAERSDFAFRSIVMAQDELHEALEHVSWKWWATDKYFDEEAFKGEVIDVLHFVLNLALVSGMDDRELYQRYCAKNAVNRERQAAGYAGRSDKCPICHAHVTEGCEHMDTIVIESL